MRSFLPRLMPRLTLLFLTVMPAGCGWYYVFSQPSIPDYRQPSQAEIEQMTQRMMGRAPAKQAPVNTDGVEVVFQTGHAGGIRALALSPNGRYIASSGSQDGSVKLWDVASGQEIRNFTGFGGIGMGADQLAFSEDSARVITHEYAGAVKLIEVATGRDVRTIGSSLSGGGAISPNGRFAAVSESSESKSSRNAIVAGSQALSVIDLASGKTLWTLPDSTMQHALAISRDGKTVVTVRTDSGLSSSGGVMGEVGSTLGSMVGLGTFFEPSQIPTFKQELLVWDVPTKSLRRTLPYAPNLDGVGGTLSPDGRYLVTEQPVERAIRVLDLEVGKPLPSITLKTAGMKGMAMTHSLAFSPDGSMLAVAKGDGLAALVEFPTGREIKRLDATSLNFSPDGRTLIVGPVSSGAPFLEDLASGKETRLAGGISEVSDLSLTADGRSIVAGMHGGSAKLWDLATGQLVRTFDCPDGMAVSSVAVSPTQPLLATGCMNGSAWLWDLVSGKQLRKLMPPLQAEQFSPVQLRISRDGQVIVIGQGTHLIVYDLSSGKELRRITLPHEEQPELLGNMEEPATAYEGLDPKMRAALQQQTSQMPSMDPQAKKQMDEAAQRIHALAIHPDGRRVAIGRSYSTTMWDVRTGMQILHFREKSRVQAQAEQQRMRDEQYRQAMEEANSMSSLLPSIPFGLGRSGPSGSRQPQIVVMDDPMNLFDDLGGDMQGARSLAFSPDGAVLLTTGVTGKTLWDVATGKKIPVAKKKVSMESGFDPASFMDRMEVNVDSLGVAMSPDGRLAARGHGQTVTVWDTATGQDRWALTGHTAAVKSVAFSPDGRLLLSGGGDGTIRVWDFRNGKELAAFIALGHEDFVTVTPDQYYRASKARIKGVSFRVKKQLYPFEQFDLRFNRPDLVLARLGMTPPEVVQSYRTAYERRLRKMGMTEQMLGADFHLPEIQLLTNELPVSVNASTVSLRVKATDDKYPLDRFHVFLNDVPIYGSAGVPLPNKHLQAHEQEMKVPLVPGRNKIQVSVLNRQGVESLKETIYLTSTASMTPPEVYVVGIGVSEYKDKAYNLRYAAKDANDVMAAYKAVEQRPGIKGRVHLLDLTNQKATKQEIRKAKDWLKQSKINDLVVVFAAGHGMTDEKSAYYFGTHDIDPTHPAVNGLPYEDFEYLLDGIPALQKVLLLDTCFSGEIDKDQPIVVAQADSGGTRAGTVKMRSFKSARGVSVVADQGTAAGGGNAGHLSSDMLRFQQDWFADLRRGTGAAVISSSSGNEYSLEGEQWKNGVFTYALLTGLKNREADANRDQAVTVSELQSYVIDQVRKLTQGGQNPTVRRENLEHDFVVY